ncbi:MAG: hypothetical protein COC00_003920 [Rhizobiales bacterium]|nr:hypothetical protein [Hyphomicrobiales bacterium]
MNFKKTILMVFLASGTVIGLTGCVSSKLDFENDPHLALSKGILSSEFGIGLVGADRLKAINAEHTALENGVTGASIIWLGANAIAGNVVPGQPYHVGSATCRTYTHTIAIAGEKRSARGTACKEKNADWAPLS